MTSAISLSESALTNDSQATWAPKKIETSCVCVLGKHGGLAVELCDDAAGGGGLLPPAPYIVLCAFELSATEWDRRTFPTPLRLASYTHHVLASLRGFKIASSLRQFASPRYTRCNLNDEMDIHSASGGGGGGGGDFSSLKRAHHTS